MTLYIPLSITLTLSALWLLLGLRIFVASKARLRVIDAIHYVNMDQIGRGNCSSLLSYSLLPTFNTTMFDLTVWSGQQLIRRHVIPAIVELPA